VKKERFFFFANGVRGPKRAAGIEPRKQIDKSLFASFLQKKKNLNLRSLLPPPR
jgi:hypothetical protein